MLAKCQTNYGLGTFGHDLEKLKVIEGLEVLQNEDAMIAVSGIYQSRIFTSSSKGMLGKSYGWVNYDLIEKGVHSTNMASLGGESRIWFGPEWGLHALFFEPGSEQIDENRRVPIDLNNKKFTEVKRSENTLTYGGRIQLKNINNFIFELEIERTIALLSQDEIVSNLDVKLPKGVSFVGFRAATTVENIGNEQFTAEKGLIALWELGCMLTSPDNKVMIPLSKPTDSITAYFTPIGDRMQIANQTVFYKADALGINKIGILPAYCKDVMGSYTPSENLLHIVSFSFQQDSPYVNSVPHNTQPYQGDVINIFNGVVDETLNIPFYEFESSSSAKALRPNEKMYHQQTTYHFEGEKAGLDKIARKILGVSLNAIPDF